MIKDKYQKMYDKYMAYRINNYIQFVKSSNFVNFRKYIFAVYYTFICVLITIATYQLYPQLQNIWIIIEYCALSIGLITLSTSIPYLIIHYTLHRSKFVYTETNIQTIENAPVMLTMLIKIHLINRKIINISQVSKIEDDQPYISIQYKFHPQDISSGYISYTRNRSDHANISYTHGQQLYKYIPEYMNVSIYNIENRKYTQSLEYWEELYFTNPRHKDIDNIEDFLLVIFNSILKIMIH